MPLSAARVESEAPDAGRLADVVHYLADGGHASLVWLDEHLEVIAQIGHMFRDVRKGTPVTQACVAFIGLEGELTALRSEPGRVLSLPNVMIADRSNQDEKRNISVHWMAQRGCYLVVAARAASPADLEYRLAAETRARAIAEAEVAAQARVLARVNDELALANRDLQEFASVISHDLRAPLRGLRYAASDARHALDTGDVPVARQNIERTIGLARRMGAMLTGLLDYARAGRKTEGAELVDTGALVAEIVDSIGTDVAHEFIVDGQWPTLTTVAEPLDIIVRNLVDNAVKHHDRTDGRIFVHGDEAGDNLIITVSDDGPGIEPEWHKAIFLPFRQITDSEDADGAGIGLALVKKTVERFGGSIEVQSAPRVRRGATFRVTWPRALRTQT